MSSEESFCDFDSNGHCTFRGSCQQKTAQKGRRLCRRWDVPPRDDHARARARVGEEEGAMADIPPQSVAYAARLAQHEDDPDYHLIGAEYDIEEAAWSLRHEHDPTYVLQHIIGAQASLAKARALVEQRIEEE